ncbi:DUF881 domain-containing protein [Cellulosimicrobium terreum]|nr:DUF881 domain-containing protein [Cellulosimicrobium terreum]
MSVREPDAEPEELEPDDTAQSPEPEPAGDQAVPDARSDDASPGEDVPVPAERDDGEPDDQADDAARTTDEGDEGDEDDDTTSEVDAVAPHHDGEGVEAEGTDVGDPDEATDTGGTDTVVGTDTDPDGAPAADDDEPLQEPEPEQEAELEPEANAPETQPDEVGPEAAATEAVETEGDSRPPAAGSTNEASTAGAASPFGRHGTPSTPPPGGLRALGRALRPSASRPQLVVGVLCALLGFAVVVQVSQTQEDQLSSLRQTDLVRLLDDVTQRSEELEDQVSDLEATRDELRSGSGAQRAAIEVAEQRAQTQGILSGRLAAQGPGVEIDVAEGDQQLRAFSLFNVLEELRNAGAEAMEVNGVRLVTSSYFEDTDDGVVVDGQVITSPYRWTAIGDPSTLGTALEIPGGAMASLRSDGARTTIRQEDLVEVDATHEPAEPEYATPVAPDEDD